MNLFLKALYCPVSTGHCVAVIVFVYPCGEPMSTARLNLITFNLTCTVMACTKQQTTKNNQWKNLIVINKKHKCACVLHTTRVDEYLHGAVVSVFVRQRDHNAGCGAGRWVGICPDGVGGTFHTYTEKRIKHVSWTSCARLIRWTG